MYSHEECEDVKRLVLRKAERVLLNITQQRKGRATDIDREAQSNETIPQKGNTPERQGKIHLGKEIVFRVSTTKQEIVVRIDRVIIGISPNCK